MNDDRFKVVVHKILRGQERVLHAFCDQRIGDAKINAEDAVMKNYTSFKGYVTKSIFDPEKQEFEERRIEQESDYDSPFVIPEAPLALAFMIVGLQRPTKRNKRS